jgi:hypothetical protein
MKFILQLIPFVIATCTTCTSYGQDFLFESASLGATGQDGGSSISGPVDTSAGQFLGVRFHLTDTVAVDHIGGHISSEGSLFGAIVPLNNLSALPGSDPMSFVPLAQTTFTATTLSSDIHVPLSVILSPGDYALIFGSQRFGATGFGSMANDNVDTPAANYIQGTATPSGGFWENSGIQGVRFVITGTVVPEPSAIALLGVGMAGLISYRCGRRYPPAELRGSFVDATAQPRTQT